MKTIKYSIQELLGVGFTLVVLGIGIAYGIDIQQDLREDFGEDACAAGEAGATYTSYNHTSGQCYNSSGTHVGLDNVQFQAINNSEVGVAKIPEKVPTIATVVVASVVIGILVTYLWARFARM